jgi:C4-dicarboxylate transporter
LKSGDGGDTVEATRNEGRSMERRDLMVMAAAAGLVALTAVLRGAGAAPVLTFAVAALALAGIAH